MMGVGWAQGRKGWRRSVAMRGRKRQEGEWLAIEGLDDREG